MSMNSTTNALQAQNPATGETLGSIELTSTEVLLRHVDELRTTSRLWLNKSPQERHNALKQLQRELIANMDDCTLVINKQTGKSRQAAMLEVLAAADNIVQVTKGAIKAGPLPSDQIAAVAVGPTYPFMHALRQSIVLLASGASVLILIDSRVPTIARMLHKLFVNADALAPHIRVAVGDVESEQTLIEHGVVRWVTEAPADEAAVTIGYFPETQPQKLDITAIGRHAYWHAGQGPLRMRLIAVPTDDLEAVAQRFVNLFESLTFGYSDLKKDLHDYGPLQLSEDADIAEKWLSAADALGVTVKSGGVRDRHFFQPTVVTCSTLAPILEGPIPSAPLLIVTTLQALEQNWVTLAENFASVSILTTNDETTIPGYMQTSGRENARLKLGAYCLTNVSGLSSDVDSVLAADTLLFVLQRIARMPRVGVDLVSQMLEPGNYRMVHAAAKALYGATVQQRAQSAEIVYNSYKVQQLLSQTNGQLQSLFETVKSVAKRG